MNYSRYDLIELLFPHQGMNRKAAPERLPPEYAWYMENIRPRPAGKGTVRFGTKLRTRISESELTYDIKGYPFFAPNGFKQTLYYVCSMVKDDHAANFQIMAQDKIAFTTTEVARREEDRGLDNYTYADSTLYEPTCPVLITYDTDVTVNLKTEIKDCEYQKIDQLGGYWVILTLKDRYFPDDHRHINIRSVFYPDASVWIDHDNGTASKLKDGFCPNTMLRTCRYQNKLFLCNGIDDVHIWDGDNLEVFYVRFRIPTDNITRTTSKRMQVRVQAGVPDDVFVKNRVILSVGGVETEIIITNAQRNQNIFTVTVRDDLPVFNNNVSLTAMQRPPEFSYMHAAHNRFFALGSGKIGIPWKAQDQSMKVYYPYAEGRLYDWYDPATFAMPSLDLTERHQVPDTLEAIASYGAYTVFFGRNQIQTFKGSTPPVGNAQGDFSWDSNIPVGIAHGNLVRVMVNDIWFVSNLDFTSIGTLNAARQMAANINDDLNTAVKDMVADIWNNNAAYRATQTVYYEYGGFCLFKIGFNMPVCAEVTTKLDRWSYWSGVFLNASGLFTDADNNLCVCSKGYVYDYADGKKVSKGFKDYNNENPVFFALVYPFVEPDKRFVCMRYRLSLQYPSAFSGNRENNIRINILSDIPRSFSLEHAAEYQNMGDLLGFGTLDGFSFSTGAVIPTGKLAFHAKRFCAALTGTTDCGEVVLDKLTLYGAFERGTEGG